MIMPQPHDLLWVRHPHALRYVTEPWLADHWQVDLPIVVRREHRHQPLIPVGIRGPQRAQRAAAWVDLADIHHQLTPENLVEQFPTLSLPFLDYPAIQTAHQLMQLNWPWRWGITGSTAYTLATGQLALHDSSDLDVIIRAPYPIEKRPLELWQRFTDKLACRVDTQVITPQGGFALIEWLITGKTLLKTATGPQVVDNPWKKISAP